MLLSKFALFILALVLAVICGFGINAVAKRRGSGAEGAGCAAAFFLTLVFWILLGFVMPQVVIITPSQDGKPEDEKSYALFSYDGHTLGFCGKYLDNKTDEDLVIYPQYYSASTDESEVPDTEDDDMTMIEPNSFTEIDHIPDYYFYEPSSISSESDKTETKWILEKTSKLVNDYMNEMERQQQIRDEILERVLNNN